MDLKHGCRLPLCSRTCQVQGHLSEPRGFWSCLPACKPKKMANMDHLGVIMFYTDIENTRKTVMFLDMLDKINKGSLANRLQTKKGLYIV